MNPRQHSTPILRFPRLAALALCAAFAAGCSNNPYPREQTAGATLYRYRTDDPKTLDPANSYVVTEAQIIDVIYQSFYQYHYLKRDPYVLELNLGAEEPKRETYRYTERTAGRAVPRVGEAWTFRIKRGIRFQDDPCFPGGRGREVRAADILFAFRRMADPTLDPPCPVTSFFEDKILGFHDYVEGNRKAGSPRWDLPVEGLQLDPDDPYVFRILLNQPYPQLRYLMAMHFTAPIPREAVERYGADLRRHPVGCGPFMLAEYRPKQRIVLVANPNRPRQLYPAEGAPGDAEAGLLQDAGQPLPRAERVVISILRENVTAWNLFLQGYLDSFSVLQENYQQALSGPGLLSEEMRRRGTHLFRAQDPNIDYFAFNMDDPVVGGYTPEKRALRQAISLAINAEDFIELQSQGNGIPAHFLVPPGIYGYDPDYRNPYRQHSLQKAKALLAKAGYPNGIDRRTGERLTIFYDNTGTTAAGRQFVGLVKKQIEAIGIRLESRAWRDIIWQDRVDRGQFQLIHWGWLADYPDSENFVFLLYGPNQRPGVNYANYKNPEYDRLFERMRSMDDGPERVRLIEQMRAIAVEDCPWIFLQHSQDLYLTQAWQRNTKPHPVANDGWKYLAVDGPLRAKLQSEWNRPNYWPLLGAAAAVLLGSLPAASVIRSRRRRRLRRTEAQG